MKLPSPRKHSTCTQTPAHRTKVKTPIPGQCVPAHAPPAKHMARHRDFQFQFSPRSFGSFHLLHARFDIADLDACVHRLTLRNHFCEGVNVFGIRP
jgi:hypothetical protein